MLTPRHTQTKLTSLNPLQFKWWLVRNHCHIIKTGHNIIDSFLVFILLFSPSWLRSPSHCCIYRQTVGTLISDLREERSLLPLLLQAVGHQPLHGLWTVAAHFAEVGRQVTSTHHEYDLWEEERGGIRRCVCREKTGQSHFTTCPCLVNILLWHAKCGLILFAL